MGSTTLSLIIVILLLVANAFFVAAEFALVKAKGMRIDQLAKGGSAAAKLNQKIRTNLEAYLAACQLGITMASLGLGWIGEPAVASLLEPLFTSFGMSQDMVHTVAFLLGFLLFSSLHIIIGEQVPKTYAIRKPEPVSLWISYPLQAFYLLAWPLNWALNKASTSILHLFNVEEVSHVEVMTGEELQNMIDVSGEHGELATEKAEMLVNLFKFDSRSVEQLMIPRNKVHVLDLQNSIEDNITVLKTSQHSRFPLVDDGMDCLLGMILAKDLFSDMLESANNDLKPLHHLKDYVREPLIAPETLTVSRLFEQMREHRTHMAFVKDEYGSFVGLITLEDLLEEIVGDILDETETHDTDYPFNQVSEHVWEIAGLIPLADLERLLHIQLNVEEIDANTLSGWLTFELQAIPKISDTVTACGYTMEVLAVKDHRVEYARLTQLPPTTEI